MSVVIGIKTKQGVWLACDKQITTGDRKQFLQPPHSKICLVPERPGIAIGSVGYLRGINLMETNNSYIEEAAYLRQAIDYNYMVNSFPILVHNLFTANGFVPSDKEGRLQLENEFLVGTPVDLFTVGVDGSVIEGNIATIGSGESLAHGVLTQGYKTDLSDKQCIKLLQQAINAASYNISVGGGGVIYNITKGTSYEF